MLKATLHRVHDNGKQTIGIMVCCNAAGEPVATYNTLELPWENNTRRVSCIPKGTYKLDLIDSPTFGKEGFYKVTTLSGAEVPGRTAIGLHRGNYNTDILGCILIGNEHADANKDGILDVLQSTVAFNALKAWAKSFELTIV